MADHDAHDDVQRDQRALAASYAQRADILARQRVADEELARIMRELDRARAAARSTTLELEAADVAIAAQYALIQRRARILSPIHHLPSELLGQVFSETLGPRNECRCEPSFVLASICRRWRLIALSSPALWASVHLNIAKRLQHATEYVCTILARSEGLPLRVCIYLGAYLKPETMIVLEESLPQVIMRADELHIGHRTYQGYNWETAELADTGFKFLQLPTPHLHHLCINTAPGQTVHGILPITPVLRSLRLSGVLLLALPRDTLRNIRKLELSMQDLANLAELSAAAPKLHRMTLDMTIAMFQLPPRTPATFSCLEELRVSGFQVLSCFTADSLPALGRLIISPSTRDDTIIDSLPSMPLLRHLELRHVELHTESCFPPNFAALIGGISQLETLVLSSVPDQADMWDEWSSPPHIAAFPRLRNLVVSGKGMETEDVAQSFGRFLEARAAVRDGETMRSPFGPLELTLRETAFPRWLVPRLERSVARVVYVQKQPKVRDATNR